MSNRESGKSKDSKNQSIQNNLESQDYFLQQALRHFKSFNADRYLSRDDLLMCQMYANVQDELVAYKLLTKHFEKAVTVFQNKISVKKSEYQIHLISKLKKEQKAHALADKI